MQFLLTKLRSTISKFKEKIKMKRINQTNCDQTRKIVEKTLKKLLTLAGPSISHVFDIANWTIEGSVRCNVKVGKPDEVDVQLPLKIPWKDIIFLRKGSCWTNEDCPCGKHVKAKPGMRKSSSYIGNNCEFKTKTTKISRDDFGMLCVKVSEESQALVHLKQYLVIRHKTHLSPRSVIAFLLMELKRVATTFNKKESNNTVTISTLVNGPAILVTIKVPKKEYDIRVDIVPSLGYPMSSLIKKSKRIISEKLEEVPKASQKEAGKQLCLVPKFDHAWILSFSKFENNIVDSFYDGDDSDDDDYDCKKDCLRYAKQKLLTWKKEQPVRLKHFSSYLSKTLLFRALTKRQKEKDWSKKYFANRYLDMMNDFAECVSKKDMREFFNDSVNLLGKRSNTQLADMKTLIYKEIKRIKNITKK